ncbi:chorismate synthase [Oscillospiraceae bacterium OttesenSCG-928-F05]|nr:chorismate synthase [Oscillospiraceae bacterium OttesenSCG-928-F05]
MGRLFRVTLFGESHGPAVGAVLDGCPPGLRLDMEEIQTAMARRAPGGNALGTTRREADIPEILSGVYDGFTTGAPVAVLFRNGDVRDEDYRAFGGKVRPGHGDYTGHVKSLGYGDRRGGGRFSARLTAGLMFAGAVAAQYLAGIGVRLCAKADAVGTICDTPWNTLSPETARFDGLRRERLPTLSEEAGRKMAACIEDARVEGDSVGGAVSAVAVGAPPGLGDPFFDSVESRLAALLFSIPAVKSVSFGAGEAFAAMRGSQANDPFYREDGQIKTRTNHAGGLNAGITNGMPILVRAVFRPTPSIGKAQETVDLSGGAGAELFIGGRHDPCVVPRAIPLVEAALAITLLDCALEAGALPAAPEKRGGG